MSPSRVALGSDVDTELCHVVIEYSQFFCNAESYGGKRFTHLMFLAELRMEWMNETDPSSTFTQHPRKHDDETLVVGILLLSRVHEVEPEAIEFLHREGT